MTVLTSLAGPSSSSTSSMPASSSPAHLELILLGTGTSAALPSATCLVSAPSIAEIACRCCRETADGTRGGERNVRANVGCVVRKRGADGRWRHILIDCGKTFREQSIKLFRQHGIDSIDAIVLTHGHSDAIGGLDDLRAWTLPPAPHRRASIPIYLSRETYSTVAEQFPYMVDTARATGGGDVPSLRFEVFEEGPDGLPREFEVEGVRIAPLPVHHGRYFTPPPPTANGNGIGNGNGAVIPERPPRATPTVTPFLCYGFLFDGRIAWLSDINHMPAETWDRMIEVVQEANPQAAVNGHGYTNGSTVNGHANGNGHSNGSTARPAAHRQIQLAKWCLVADPADRPTLTPGQLPYLIIDTLFMREHPSHLSFLQTVKSARDIDAQRTLCVGFTHPLAHAEWLAGYRAVDGSPAANALPREDRIMAEIKQYAAQQGMQVEWEEAKAWGGCVRPAWDGQRIGLDEAGRIVRYEDEENEREWA